MGIAQVRAVERGAGRDLAVWLGVRRGRLGVGRFEAHAARGFDRAKQDLQHMQRAAGLKAVGMCRYATHGVKRDRAPDHLVVFFASEIGPGTVQLDRFVKGHAREVGGNGTDAFGRNPAAFGDGLWRVGIRKITVRHLVKDRAVRDTFVAIGGRQVRLDAHTVPGGQLAGVPVDDLRLAILVAQEKAELFGARVFVHQNRGIGEACQVIQINLARLHQAMDHRKNEETIGARRDPDPIIRHGVVACADRIDTDHARAAFLDLADPHLDGVAVMVLCNPEEHEQLGMIPVRLAEFPERPAHRIDAGSGHIDRTEPAVGRIIGRAETLRPETGEGLRLVAAGEERQFFGVVFAHWGQPFGRQRQCLLP